MSANQDLVLIMARSRSIHLRTNGRLSHSHSGKLEAGWAKLIHALKHIASRADWIFAIRYYPHTDKKAATFKVINKQITFPRPGQEEKFLSRTLRLKYALAVLLVAFIFRKQSWLLPQLHFDTLRQVINFLSQKSKSSLSL